MTRRAVGLGCGLGLAFCAGGAPAADVRAKAEVACAPTARALEYDCTITLSDRRSGEPLAGLDVVLGAEMPSMPMAHNVRPAAATPTGAPGAYRARLALEMHGEWALRIDLTGAVRDRVVKTMRFEDAP